MRIRKSDFDAFIAAGEMRAKADFDPDHAAQWKEIRAAAKAASDAARLGDRAALRNALRTLSESGGRLDSFD